MPLDNDPKSATEQGAAFESRVADLYRSLGYRVEQDVRLEGTQIDIVATRYVEGVGPIVLAIECKDYDANVGNTIVDAFVVTVEKLRIKNSVTAGVMICRNKFTEPARAAVRGLPHIALLSITELAREAVTVSTGLQRIVNEYESSEVFHAFIRLEGKTIQWNSLGLDVASSVTSAVHDPLGKRKRGRAQSAPAPAPDVPDLLGQLLDWSAHRSMKAVFLLGDYGVGKSTILRRLQHDLAIYHLRGLPVPIPVFVALKQYSEVGQIGALVRQAARDQLLRDFSLDFIEQQVEEGQFALLLDGFDEMVERSDLSRRFLLFQQLLPYLNAGCFTILTSRPSYFVEKGELADLLSTLIEEQKPMSVFSDKKVGKKAARHRQELDRLKNRLLVRSRDSGPDLPQMPRDSGLTVLVPQPLTREKILEYAALRANEVASHRQFSASAFLKFIERVYDLRDLATRPLLLKMLVDTVVEGGIDVRDESLVLGPSGLYELYTTLKLDLDWSKGRTRRRGLSRDERRTLAERVAIYMHRNETLVAGLGEVMASLQNATEFNRSTTDSTVDSDLSESEILTDFLTCSFLTVGDDSRFRFVHKSFREFFVARTIKNLLNSHNPLLDEWLEREVLYFLGGFCPTEPRVGNDLWSLYVRTPVSDGNLRRNVVAAFLHTTPIHSGRSIKHVQIADVEYGALELKRSTFRQVEWRQCDIGSLSLRDPSWKATSIVDSSVGELGITGGSFDCTLKESAIGQAKIERSAISISLSRSRVGSVALEDCTGTLVLDQTEVDIMSAQDSALTIQLLSLTSIKDIDLRGSRALIGDTHLRTFSSESLRAQGSVLIMGDAMSSVGWICDSCVIAVREYSSPGQIASASSDSVFVGFDAHTFKKQILERHRCGFIGWLQKDVGVEDLVASSGWGVLIMAHHKLKGHDKLRGVVLAGRFIVGTLESLEYACGLDQESPLSTLLRLTTDPSNDRVVGRLLYDAANTQEYLGQLERDYKMAVATVKGDS